MRAKREETFSDVQRRAGRTPSVPNALVASFERVSDVRLACEEFCYFFQHARRAFHLYADV